MKKKCLGGFFLECSILPDVSLGERSPKVVKCIPLEALEIIGLGRCCLGSCHGLWVIKARHMGGRGSCGGKIEGKLSSSYELWQGQLKKITKIYIYTYFIHPNKIKDTRQDKKFNLFHRPSLLDRNVLLLYNSRRPFAGTRGGHNIKYYHH